MANPKDKKEVGPAASKSDGQPAQSSVGPLAINGERLLADLRHLRTLTDTPGEGVTRFSYGLTDRDARAYLKAAVTPMGCSWATDGVGNVRIGHPGNRPGRKTVMAGSHIDTVRNGGWLDGVYGSVAALEVLRTLVEVPASEAPSINKNFEVVLFAEEEGSNFDSTLTGSKFATYKYKQSDLEALKNHSGQTLGQILHTTRMGSEEIGLPWDLTEVEAMIEMHIEQGPVLEREAASIGIVDSIFGMRLVEFQLTGTGNHAGASPMIGRRDALTAASICIQLVEHIAGRDPRHETVATVGKLFVEPNCSNVIPEKVTFTVEVRDSVDQIIQDTMNEIIKAITKETQRRGIQMTLREVSSSKPVGLAPSMIKPIEAAAKEQGMVRDVHYKIMGSGAVHDAAMMARYVATGMIFVPSIGGRSHVKEEDTREQDLIVGANLLLAVVKNLLK